MTTIAEVLAWLDSMHAGSNYTHTSRNAATLIEAMQTRNAKLTAAALSALETLTANPAIDPGNVRAKLVEALETNL